MMSQPLKGFSLRGVWGGKGRGRLVMTDGQPTPLVLHRLSISEYGTKASFALD